jgi:hypothetical protein
LSGVSRLIANHPLLAVFESASEVRALSSAGVTRPRRSYDPVRLPHGPPPRAASKPRPPTAWVSPDHPHHHITPFQRAVPNTPMDRTGACVDCFPSTRPSPMFRRVGIHVFTFEACSRLYSHYGPLDRATAQRRPLSRGSGPASRPPDRSSATRSIDTSLDGIFLHW